MKSPVIILVYILLALLIVLAAAWIILFCLELRDKEMLKAHIELSRQRHELIQRIMRLIIDGHPVDWDDCLLQAQSLDEQSIKRAGFRANLTEEISRMREFAASRQ